MDIISYTTITAFLSECSKFGLFLGTDICTSEEYWYSNISEEFSGSKSCKIGMGGYLSIGSFVAYFISMILAISNFTTAPQTDYTHGEEDSLPSWMLDEDGTIIPNAKKPPENKVPDYNRSSLNYDWSTQSDSLEASKRNVNNSNQSNQRLQSSRTGPSPAERHRNMQSSFNQSDSRMHRRVGSQDSNVHSSFNSDDQRLHDSRRGGPYNVNSSFNQSNLYDSRTGNEQYQQVEDYAIDEMIKHSIEPRHLYEYIKSTLVNSSNAKQKKVLKQYDDVPFFIEVTSYLERKKAEINSRE